MFYYVTHLLINYMYLFIGENKTKATSRWGLILVQRVKQNYWLSLRRSLRMGLLLNKRGKGECKKDYLLAKDLCKTYKPKVYRGFKFIIYIKVTVLIRVYLQLTKVKTQRVNLCSKNLPCVSINDSTVITKRIIIHQKISLLHQSWIIIFVKRRAMETIDLKLINTSC